MAQAPGTAEAHRRVHGRGEVVSLCRMDAAMMGRAEGVVEDAEESGVCGAQQVAALHFHEQVQGAEVVPAASVSVAPSAQFR